MYITIKDKTFEFNLKTLENSQLLDSSLFARIDNLVIALEKSNIQKRV